MIATLPDKSFDKLDKFLSHYLPNRIFLVTGKSSFNKSGARDIVLEKLRHFDFIQFHDFEKNPKIDDVKKGVELFNWNKCDLIIGIGGGSVIDMAKLINYYQKNPDQIEFIEQDDFSDTNTVPLVAIPTTAGTGSEVTHFAVVYKNRVKYSVANNNLLPELYILEPIFLKSLSQYEKAVSGIDAFSQAMESYWAINSTAESRNFSLAALELLWNNLLLALKNDDAANKSIMVGANMAGKAINISKTTAPHAVSYPITSFYGIPHGHAVALTLPHFLDFNYKINNDNCLDNRGPEFVITKINEIVRQIGFDTIDNAVEGIKNWIRSLGMELSLRNLGIDKTSLDLIVKKGFNTTRMSNNPRKVSSIDLQNILIEIY